MILFWSSPNRGWNKKIENSDRLFLLVITAFHSLFKDRYRMDPRRLFLASDSTLIEMIGSSSSGVELFLSVLFHLSDFSAEIIGEEDTDCKSTLLNSSIVFFRRRLLRCDLEQFMDSLPDTKDVLRQSKHSVMKSNNLSRSLHSLL